MFGEKGLIQVYTGDGKGKTTAALGLALRAAGRGAKIAFVQFMKGSPVYGEIVSLESRTCARDGRSAFSRATKRRRISRRRAAG